MLVKKCVSDLIMNTNLKNFHHQQDYFFSFFLCVPKPLLQGHVVK